MKRIGLIGGVSPESTILYYQMLNEAARQAYGPDCSAEIIIHSLNFGEMYDYYLKGDWSTFKTRVVDAARGLAAQSCGLVAISSNTTQVAAADAAQAIEVPVIDLVASLASEMHKDGVKRPLLLGTPFVMTGDYYRPELQTKYGLACIIPDAAGQKCVDRVIFQELVRGQVRQDSRQAYLDLIEKGRAEGADSVILGCTEIGMLIEQRHTTLPVYDTTRIHAAAIARAAFASPLAKETGGEPASFS